MSPREILAGKAPWQVTPGVRVLIGQYVNELGRVQGWQAHYDNFGRLIARTDYNAGNRAAGIAATHHHQYGYKRSVRYTIADHVTGEYNEMIL